MARYDASTAEVLIFTFKDGLLSAVAHDLKLRATKLTIDHEGVRVVAEIDASSLRVVTPMKDGAENPSALPRMVFGEIEKNASDVLRAGKHASIRFESTSITETELRGRLTLNGQTREVTGRRKTPTSVEFTLDQRDFGIKAFSAMLGTLKVKPVLTVTAQIVSV